MNEVGTGKTFTMAVVAVILLGCGIFHIHRLVVGLEGGK